MKRRIFALLSTVALSVGLAVAAPTAAVAYDWQPTWRSYNPTTFTIPAGWACGKTDNGRIASSQSCIIRTGNYVQAAYILRNRASISVPVRARARVYKGIPGNSTAIKSDDFCAPSRMAARGLSVCFGSTQYMPQQGFTGGNAWWDDPAVPAPYVGAYYSPVR